MTNIIGTLVYQITGDSSALNAALDSSRAKMEKTGKQLETMGSQVRTFATRVITGYLIKSLIDASSRATELSNKFNTVFKGVESETESWIRTYADATNRGIIATKEFLATQQDIRTGYGDNVAAAAKFSRAVVGTTNDLASFSNVPVAEAMQAMQSGLSYQFEALRRLGIGLNVAIINQQDYALSIGKTWEQMDNLEKQEAVLSGIMQQSANALHQNVSVWKEYDYTLGDAAATSDSFANTAQGVQQRMVDLKAELGDALMPVATSVGTVLLDLIQGFNGLSEGLKVATTAAIAFTAAKVMMAGPLGTIVGLLGAAVIGVSALKKREDEMATATRSLTRSSREYKNILSDIEIKAGELTDRERDLLEIRKAAVRADVLKSLSDVAKGYQSNIEKISEYENGLETLNIFMDRTISRRKQLANSGREDAQTMLEIANLDSAILKLETEIAEKSGELSEQRLQQTLAIDLIARAYNDGTVSLENYKEILPDLYNEIITVAEVLKKQESETQAAATATDNLAKASREWRTELLKQEAALAEDAGNLTKAATLRKQLLDQERDIDIRKMAEKAKLIKRGEQLDQIPIETLIFRLIKEEGTKAELLALEQYYKNEKSSIDKEVTKLTLEEAEKQGKAWETLALKRIENSRLIQLRLDQQMQSGMQATAMELEAAGDFERAYQLRSQVLDSQMQAELLEMQEKVDAQEATEAELLAIRTYYGIEQEKLEQEKQKSIARAAEDSLRKQVDDWRNAMDRIFSFAKNLSSSIGQIYSNITDKQLGELERQKQAALENAGLLEDTEIQRLQHAYDEAVRIGDAEKAASIAAEKDKAIAKAEIEAEYDEKAKELQRRQAERDRELKIYSALINMASAIIGFMANPGGWAGLGLSAMAGIEGGAQIAAIKSTPLPSFDVGVWDVPRDMEAKIHKGETILPAPMAESVRKGDAVISGPGAGSGGDMNVTIINNTGEAATKREWTDPDGTRQLEVIIGEVTDKQVRSGRFDSSMNDRYGVTRRGRRG